MGGYSIYTLPQKWDQPEIGLSLPCRNILWKALRESNGWKDWESAIIEKCKTCFNSYLKREPLIRGLKKALEYIEKRPNWHDDMERNWTSGRSYRDVVLDLIKFNIEHLERLDCEEVYMNDDLSSCNDPCEFEKGPAHKIEEKVI